MGKRIQYVYLQPGQLPPQEQPSKAKQQPQQTAPQPQPKAAQSGGVDGFTVFLLAIIGLMAAWGGLS